MEKIDERAFHRKHMFQVVIVPSRPAMIPNTPSQITLYLQAAVSVCVCVCVRVCVCACVSKGVGIAGLLTMFFRLLCLSQNWHAKTAKDHVT